MASSQFGANTAGGRRQKRCLNPVGLRGISSPLFRDSLIDTWGLAWRAEDNTSIVFTVFWIKTSVNRSVFAGGLARLQTWTFSFLFNFFPCTVRLCLWQWNTCWSTSAFHNKLGIFFFNLHVMRHTISIMNFLKRKASFKIIRSLLNFPCTHKKTIFFCSHSGT